MRRVTCRVFVSDRGNVFMREIADHLVESMVLAGRPAELVTDALPAPSATPLDNLVVAPHEFFALFPASESDLLGAAANAVCINTEQSGTPFFDTAVRYAQHGPVVFDINPWSLGALRRLGLAAVHLPLGYVPSMDHWRRAQRERRIDLTLLAGRTARREELVAGAGSQLWEWRTDLRFYSWHRPATSTKPAFLSGSAKFEHLADSRIILNIHRDDDPYFEWARVIEAIANGCVVATETSVGCEPLVPGEHLLMASFDELAEQAIGLAFDEPRRAVMAEAAYDVLTTKVAQADLISAALVAASNAPRTRRALTPRFGAAARGVRDRAASIVRREHGLPAERIALAAAASRTKSAYLAALDHGRRVERALATLRHGDPHHQVLITTPAWDAADPADVSVVVPLFNQGAFLAEAVHSVVAAAGRRRAELVIVDDHSTDGSGDVAAALLAEMPWMPAVLVRCAANGGLPAARNAGIAHARAPYVFTLDADNAVYPNAFELLAGRLDRSPPEVVAAYGILERFDERGSIGLTSHLPWDPDLLVHGAFIDAMAMFRREVFAEIGGYDAGTPAIFGWEDYDLWLTIAERGWRADLAASVVGRYREHAGSMRKVSDIDMAANFVRLRERHPRLAWPS